MREGQSANEHRMELVEEAFRTPNMCKIPEFIRERNFGQHQKINEEFIKQFRISQGFQVNEL